MRKSILGLFTGFVLVAAGCSSSTTSSSGGPSPTPKVTNPTPQANSPAVSSGKYVDAIVGVWNLPEGAKEDVPAGATLEFTKDGKAIATMPAEGKKEEKVVGRYTIVDNKLTIFMPDPEGGKEHTEIMMISELTADKLVFQPPGKKIDVTFTRKK